MKKILYTFFIILFLGFAQIVVVPGVFADGDGDGGGGDSGGGCGNAGVGDGVDGGNNPYVPPPPPPPPAPIPPSRPSCSFTFDVGADRTYYTDSAERLSGTINIDWDGVVSYYIDCFGVVSNEFGWLSWDGRSQVNPAFIYNYLGYPHGYGEQTCVVTVGPWKLTGNGGLDHYEENKETTCTDTVLVRPPIPPVLELSGEATSCNTISLQWQDDPDSVSGFNSDWMNYYDYFYTRLHEKEWYQPEVYYDFFSRSIVLDAKENTNYDFWAENRGVLDGHTFFTVPVRTSNLVSVSTPECPSPSTINLEEGCDFCTGPQQYFSGQYESDAGLRMRGFWVRLDDGPISDAGVCSGGICLLNKGYSVTDPYYECDDVCSRDYNFAFNVVNNPVYEERELAFGQTYYWTVKVWDEMGYESSWVQGPVFTTEPHLFPTTDFHWINSSGEEYGNIYINQNVTFISDSVCYDDGNVPVACDLDWTFVGANIESSSSEFPVVQFDSIGYKLITLQATDPDGNTCEPLTTVTDPDRIVEPEEGDGLPEGEDGEPVIEVELSVPSWREILPINIFSAFYNWLFD
ncbi:MAG: hypothetical protein ABII97_01435 [Patescibacteria group bacterium]